MTARAIEEKKAKKRTEETFDFPETTDLCDFGYVLAGALDSRPAPAPTASQPSK